MRTIKRAILVGLGLIGLLLVVGLFIPPPVGGPAGTVATPAPTVSVRAHELVSAYAANEVAADQRFRGQRLAVDGIIVRIEKTLRDEPYLALAGPTGALEVQAVFRKSEEAALAELKPDRYVQVECTGAGKGLSLIVLNDCVMKKR